MLLLVFVCAVSVGVGHLVTHARSSAPVSGSAVLPAEVLRLADGRTANKVDGRRALAAAVLGEVFDVSLDSSVFAPRGPFSGLAGRDASRALLTGDASGLGPLDALDDVRPQDARALLAWRDAFRARHRAVGRVEGAFYDADGRPTPALTRLERLAERPADRFDERFEADAAADADAAARRHAATARDAVRAPAAPASRERLAPTSATAPLPTPCAVDDELGRHVPSCPVGRFPRRVFGPPAGDDAGISERCGCFETILTTPLRRAYPQCAFDAHRCAV